MKINSSNTIFLIKLSLGLAVIIFCLLWLDFKSILNIISAIQWKSIFFLFMIYVLDRLFMAYKWGLLIKSFKRDISMWKLSKAYFWGSFTSQFMPISISGDLVRFYTVNEEGLSKTYLFSSMVIEKIFGFISMIFVVVIAIILYSSPLSKNEHFYNGITISIILIFLAIILTYLVLKTHLISNKLEKYKGRYKKKITNVILSFKYFSNKKVVLKKFFLYSLVEQIFPVLAIFILARSLHINISFLQVLFISSLALLLARLPISPSSIGIQEGAFVGLFILVGLKGESGFALGFSMRILDMIYPLPFILFYLSDTLKLLKKSKKNVS